MRRIRIFPFENSVQEAGRERHAVKSTQDLAHQRSLVARAKRPGCFIPGQNWGSLILGVIGALPDIRAIFA
jgi:hypothetical protein